MLQPRFTLEEYKKQPEDLRIGIVISDGMWYSVTKWRKIAKVSEEKINSWIKENLANGMLVQAETGARSYRFPLLSIKKWYSDNSFHLGEQLIDFLFPPRVWCGMTETEGFLKAPLREIGIVSFACAPDVATIISEELRGIARVRETEPGQFKAYCLDSQVVKGIIEKLFLSHPEYNVGKIYSRSVAKRRELVDFPPDFNHGLITFYQGFGKSLVKSSMDTISIFLPDPEEQDTQIVMWVIAAVEKFDESTAVPFSGYLNSVLRRWPYDLPYTHLGKELSNFQRQRSKAIKTLTKSIPDRTKFTNKEVAQEMDVDQLTFNSLEEKHKIWLGNKSATSLTWAENGEEKATDTFITSPTNVSVPTDVDLANKVSFGVIQAAIETEDFDGAFAIISQIDASNINLATIRDVSEEFIQALGVELGILEGL